jgi:hypothetical protein
LTDVLSRLWIARRRPAFGRRPRRAFALLAAIAWLGLGVGAAQAVQSVRVPVETDAIDLTNAVEHYGAHGDRIQVSTAPGADGIVRRIEVSALEAGAQPAWIVFALTNVSTARASSGPTSAPRASPRSPPARAARPSARTVSTPTFSA